MKHNTIFTAAIEPIVERIRNLLKHESRPVVVLIGAPAHSGKSTLSRKLEETLTREGTSVTTLSNDCWLMGTNRTPPDTIVTVMENVDAVAFEKAIHRLVSGETIRPPVYDSKRRIHVQDEGEEVSFKEGVLVLDGSVILAIRGVREISSLNIYVDTPDYIRLGWLRQCSLGFKGLSPDKTRRRLEAGQKREAPIAKATMEYADIVYQPGGLPRTVECDH